MMTRMMSRRSKVPSPIIIIIIALLFVIASASPAIAQSDANDAAFKTGLDHYNRGAYADAISTWETLITTLGETSGFKVLYNLGLAYQEMGNVTKAIDRYRAFLAQCEARPTAEQPDLAMRMTDAKRRVTELEAAHGKVFIRPPSKGPLVLTRVNGGEPRTAGYTLWLAPGKHEVELFVGTDHVKKVDVTVEKGGAYEIDSTPVEIAPPPPTPTTDPRLLPPPPIDNDSRARTVAIIGAGVSIASVALPISLYFVAKSKGDDARDLGAGHTSYPSALDDYNSTRTIYLASYAVPIVLGAVTVGLYFILSGKKADPVKTAFAF
jgi:hypothetical protein